jgi:hypothetical protein
VTLAALPRQGLGLRRQCAHISHCAVVAGGLLAERRTQFLLDVTGGCHATGLYKPELIPYSLVIILPSMSVVLAPGDLAS